MIPLKYIPYSQQTLKYVSAHDKAHKYAATTK